jgi:hypothetical protein
MGIKVQSGKCPLCGGDVRLGEVERMDQGTAECSRWGSPIDMER